MVRAQTRGYPTGAVCRRAMIMKGVYYVPRTRLREGPNPAGDIDRDPARRGCTDLNGFLKHRVTLRRCRLRLLFGP
jgi:hypothetical protein